MTRIERLAKKLGPRGLDGLIIGRESRVNRRYLYGFRSSGGILLVAASGESWLVIDGRYTELAARKAAEQGYHLVTAETDGDYDRRAAEVCRGAGLSTLGYEDHIVSCARFRRMQQLYPCKLAPAGGLVEEMRACKSEQEVRHIENAQRIAERALGNTLSFIRPGVTEREIARELTVQLYRGGAEELAFPVFCLSGPHSSRPHGATGDRPVQPGDFVLLDFGAVEGGYYSDMTRTVAVGYATDEMQTVYNTVLEAQEKGMEKMRPGAPGCDVDAAAREIIDKAGYKGAFAHLFGHGLGLTVAEAPMADRGENTPLPQGAVLTAEPGIYLPGRMGVRIEDMLWLGPQGTINLTQAPKELLVL